MANQTQDNGIETLTLTENRVGGVIALASDIATSSENEVGNVTSLLSNSQGSTEGFLGNISEFPVDELLLSEITREKDPIRVLENLWVIDIFEGNKTDIRFLWLEFAMRVGEKSQYYLEVE